jgi:perosamine synthetase
MQIDRAKALIPSLPSLGYGSMAPSAHQRWAGRVRGFVRRHLDQDSIRPLEVVASSVEYSERLSFEQYEFRANARPPFRATLISPTVCGRRPAILVCPGRNATLAAVTGVEPLDYPDRNVSEQFALAGFATLTLDYGLLGGWNSAVVNNRDETTLLSLALGLIGRSPLALMVEDALCALSWLESQTAIDPCRLGIFGHSLGAHLALHVALAFGRPIPVCLSSFLSSYSSLYFDHASAGGAHALPGVYRTVDLPDLVAALAPAPLQVQIGLSDSLISPDDAERAIDTVRRSYQDAKAQDVLDVHFASMGHGTDIRAAECFFEKSYSSQVSTDRTIPIVVPPAKVYFDFHARREILDRVDESLGDGILTLGENGVRLEQLAKRWTGASNVVALSAGTSALQVALQIIGVRNRTVLIPANTFFATALAALHAGAEVGFVDIELDGLGIDPNRLRVELDRRPDVAAVVFVHIGGVVAPSILEGINLCKQRGIPVIEDAAHALGSSLGGTPAGVFGDFAAFSMYPTKIVTSAEGGFLTCRSDSDASTARLLRDQGKDSFASNIHSKLGYNWRMSEVHASIGIAHFERLDRMLEERCVLARRYNSLMQSARGARPFLVPTMSASNYYKYIAYLADEVDRGDLKEGMRSRYGVQLAGEVYELPCCAQPYFGARYSSAEFPHAYEFCKHHICLPIFPTMTEEQQKLTVCAISAVATKPNRAAVAASM